MKIDTKTKLIFPIPAIKYKIISLFNLNFFNTDNILINSYNGYHVIRNVEWERLRDIEYKQMDIDKFLSVPIADTNSCLYKNLIIYGLEDKVQEIEESDITEDMTNDIEYIDISEL